MFKKLIVYLFALMFLYFAFTVSGIKLIYYFDTIALVYLMVMVLLGASCFNRKQWDNFSSALQGKTEHLLDLQRSQHMLERLWVFIMAGVGVNLLIEFFNLLGDIHNKTTLGSVLALWILNFIYLIVLRWLVYQPVSLRLQRLSLDLRIDC